MSSRIQLSFAAHPMHAAAWRALRAAHQLRPRPACRSLVGARRPPARSFHSSTVTLRAPEEPAGAAASEKKDDNDQPKDGNCEPGLKSEAAEGAEDPIQSSDVLKRSTRRQGQGSSERRTRRHMVTTGLPPLVFPEWFWEKNVTCFGEPEDLARCVDVGNPDKDAEFYDLIQTDPKAFNDVPVERVLEMGFKRLIVKSLEFQIHKAEATRREVTAQVNEISEKRCKGQELESELEKEYPHTDQAFETSWNQKTLRRAILRLRYTVPASVRALLRSKEPSSWYSISDHIYAEIYACFSGELRLPAPKTNIKDVNRQAVILRCPARGGLKYLDAVVQSVANVLEVDVIRLDAEDIAQIVGGYHGEDVAWRQSPTAMLGYWNSKRSDKFGSKKLVSNDEDATSLSENDDSKSAGGKHSSFLKSIDFLWPSSKIFPEHNSSKVLDLGNLLGRSANSGTIVTQGASPGENWSEYKISRAMDAIVGAADVKRTQSVYDEVKDQRLPRVSSLQASKGLIIQVRGYNRLNNHPLGYNLLKSLREAAKRRWYDGENVMVVGTQVETAEELAEQLSDTYANQFAPEIAFDRPRTIWVPPGRHLGRIDVDQILEIRDLNIRHVEYMIRRLLGPESESHWTININRDIWIDADSDICKAIWNYESVRKVATNMIGIAGSDRLLDWSILEHALRLSRLSEIGMLDWARQQLSEVTQDVISETNDDDIISSSEEDAKRPGVEEAAKKKNDWLDKLKAKCTTYEKKLLGGVINPFDIHTTFADVRTPSETIEALKSLTSLSLIRPDSFSYGVLASDRIPGVLLYGPPGTGKTLLAKAVAKESGATMLEVSASEINDMYVGEGEKNVKALFSLAKKLAPCVVFIDEADSLFGSRGNSFQRKSHREIINQFLREWDGMATLSALIMVATNRPFDLDEAVLRRLPRRLLVDLPMEKDREAILQIHLKDEILDESISLASIAKNTPYYSGSDLKNLSVAAALACVRDENEIAAKHNGDGPYVYPSKRVLLKEHFDKAMEEISASISEDMSTLRAIRQFDERYGDRKGRPKKKPGMGFGRTADPEPDSDAGRVRKLDLNV